MLFAAVRKLSFYGKWVIFSFFKKLPAPFVLEALKVLEVVPKGVPSDLARVYFALMSPFSLLHEPNFGALSSSPQSVCKKEEYTELKSKFQAGSYFYFHMRVHFKAFILLHGRDEIIPPSIITTAYPD